MIDRETFIRTLEPALDYGPRTHDASDYLQSVVEGRMQFWSAGKTALLTELVDYPKLRAIRGVATAGDLSEVRQLIRSAEEWGRSQGCSIAIGGGRPGWARALEHQGYENACVLLTKNLSDL